MAIATMPPAGRIPVSLTLDEASPGVALLVQDDLPVPAGLPTVRFRLPAAGAFHRFGCACCAPRNPAAAALAALFHARARGQVAWFDRVATLLKDERGRAAVVAALADDLLVMARFVEAADES